MSQNLYYVSFTADELRQLDILLTSESFDFKAPGFEIERQAYDKIIAARKRSIAARTRGFHPFTPRNKERD